MTKNLKRSPVSVPLVNVLGAGERIMRPVLLIVFIAIGISCVFLNKVSAQASPARDALSLQLEEKQTTSLKQAKVKASKRGWALVGEYGDTGEFRLHGLAPDGRPVHYATLSANAGISTATDLVRDDSMGNLGNQIYSNVTGSGQTIGVWDSGIISPTHTEFMGRNVSVGDGATTPSTHSHLVTGVAAATGVDPNAIGMAPEADIVNFDFGTDLAEMTANAQALPAETGKLLVSNHSYLRQLMGWERGNLLGTGTEYFWLGVWGEDEDRNFGAYNTNSRDMDAICEAAPYYLSVWACGNDRSSASSRVAPSNGTNFMRYDNVAEDYVTETYDSSIHPASDFLANATGGGFDLLTPSSCAKNVLTVGSVLDAVTGGVRDPAVGTSSTFSSWGPADDGRIKPDLVGNGSGVYGPVGLHPTTMVPSYTAGSGTSFAAPNVAGSALLLYQLWEELGLGDPPRSSTMKGLILHTATDIGNPGPDYTYGWGLMDTAEAANLLLAHSASPSDFYLWESSVSTIAPAQQVEITSDGTGPLHVTLCWIDPPGTPQDGLDIATPALVNDLDIKLTGPGATEHFPFLLDVNQPSLDAITGDNDVDNVEQVLIATPVAGNYTLDITMGGALLNGDPQQFSLIISGQQTAALSVESWASY